MSTTCRHCRTRPVCRPRKLCHRCYYTPGVREQYPSTARSAPHRPSNGPPETMEEVEAIIAEQMLCLPPWWPTERPFGPNDH